MKTWKEDNLLNEKIVTYNEPSFVGKTINNIYDRFSTKRTISGYEPTAADRSEMKSNAADLSKMLYKMCDIVGGRGSSEQRKALGSLEDVKAEFEETLKMFYNMLDDIRR